MKKKIFVILFIMFIFLSYGVYRSFFDMSHLPEGSLIKESESPNGNYTIKTYVSETSLSSPAIRGELNYNNIKKQPKNIYWGYRQDTVKIEWIDESTVIINNNKLNVLKDKFDFRNNKK